MIRCSMGESNAPMSIYRPEQACGDIMLPCSDACGNTDGCIVQVADTDGCIVHVADTDGCIVHVAT